MKKPETPPPGFGVRDGWGTSASRYMKFLDGDLWLIEDGDYPGRTLASVRSSIFVLQKKQDPAKRIITLITDEGLYVQSVDREAKP
jgi:hypothetical protein